MFANRWYQDEGQFAILDYFDRGGKGNPLAVFPTGTGKSVIIAQLIQKIFFRFPNQRVMMLTHDKRLIEQNARKLQQVWPHAPLGVYSAGLNSREVIMPIIFAGVQSVSKEIQRAINGEYGPGIQSQHFGHRDLIFVDEAHLISQKDTSDYQFVLSELRKINPYIKVIGLTATPYRMRQGMITDDGIFTDVCYDISGVEAFNRLIREGFLSTLIPRPTMTSMNMDNASVARGDFTEKAMDEALADEIMYEAVRELVNTGNHFGRWSWLSFAPSIKKAEQINAMLQSFGVDSVVVHSKLKTSEINERIEAYKKGYVRSMVNKDMLTTGFDHPPVDLIGMFRPTVSPGLWVQMLGRGTRPFDPANPGDVDPFFTQFKENCIVMDFAKNTPRLGPINDPVIPRKPGQSGGGAAPVRICPEDKKDSDGRFGCGTYNHSSAKLCVLCGFKFPMHQKIFQLPGQDELVRGVNSIKAEAPVIEYLKVKQVFYSKHQKTGAPPSIKVTYVCGIQSFNEWVCIEHDGFPGKKARDWWKLRHREDPPASVDEALKRCSELRPPDTIRVHLNKKHPEILSAEW
jgi:DNA repair protein RadD